MEKEKEFGGYWEYLKNTFVNNLLAAVIFAVAMTGIWFFK